MMWSTGTAISLSIFGVFFAYSIMGYFQKRDQHRLGREKIEKIFQNCKDLGFESTHVDYLSQGELSDFSFSKKTKKGAVIRIYIQQSGEIVVSKVSVYKDRKWILKRDVQAENMESLRSEIKDILWELKLLNSQKDII